MSDITDDRQSIDLTTHPWAPKASPEPSQLPGIPEVMKSEVVSSDEQIKENESRNQQKEKAKLNQVQPLDVIHYTDNLPAIPRRVRSITQAKPQTEDQLDFTVTEVQEEHGNLGIIVRSSTISAEFSIALDCSYCLVAGILLWKMFPPKWQHLKYLLLSGFLRLLMIIGQILRRGYFSKQPNLRKVRRFWIHNAIYLTIRVVSIATDLYIIWIMVQSVTANVIVQIVTFLWNILHLSGLIMQQSFINEKLNIEKKSGKGSSTTQTPTV